MKTLDKKFEEWAKANNIQNRWENDNCDYYAHKTGFIAGYELAQKEMQAKLDEAVEVIKFYSRKVKYESIRQNEVGSIYDDNGKRARNYLEKLESEK